jgi:hypothetical protein
MEVIICNKQWLKKKKKVRPKYNIKDNVSYKIIIMHIYLFIHYTHMYK